MLFRHRRSFRAPMLCFLAPVALFTATQASAAEQSIIKHPGDHPNYSVEIEPHLLAALIAPVASDGYGIGVRFSIPIVDNGFVSTINNSVAIGFGLDWEHFSGCYGGWYYGYNAYCPDINRFDFPVVMQWNFFLSTHFSVFGEPGIGLHYTTWPDAGACTYYDGSGRLVMNNCGGRAGGRFEVDPLILMVGGRYHFSEKAALTARIGFPYFSIGVSFFP